MLLPYERRSRFDRNKRKQPVFLQVDELADVSNRMQWNIYYLLLLNKRKVVQRAGGSTLTV